MRNLNSKKKKYLFMVIAVTTTLLMCIISSSKIIAQNNNESYIKVVGKIIYYDTDYSAINIDLYLNYYFNFYDPKDITTYKIEGSNDGCTWNSIYVGSSSTAPDHFREGKTYLSYRLNIKNGNAQYRYYRMDIGYCSPNDESDFVHCAYDTTDMTKYDILDPHGFSREFDGWPITNIAESFGYSSKPGEDSNMPKERLSEVYDINLLERLSLKLYKFNWAMNSFKGYCYGMALTSIAEYNNQIDLFDEYSYERRRLNMYSYYLHNYRRLNAIDGSQFYTIKDYKNVVKLIEQCFLAQGSKEMYDVEVFKPTSENGYYSGLIEYLSNVHNKPLLITCFHHAMVLETAIAPVEYSDGWVRLAVYDVNYPSDVNYIVNKYVAYNYESQLFVNTKTGQVKYINAYNEKKTQVCSRKDVHFFDPSKLSNNFYSFNSKLHFASETSYFGALDNVEIRDEYGRIIFKSEDGVIVNKTDDCKVIELACGDATNEVSIVGFDLDSFTIVTQDNEYGIISEESIMLISADGMLECDIDLAECTINASAIESSNIDVSIQDDIKTDEPTGISVKTQIGRDESITITKNDDKTSVKSKNDIVTDILLDNNNTIKEFENISLNTINNIFVEDLKIEEIVNNIPSNATDNVPAEKLEIEKTVNIMSIEEFDSIVKENGTADTIEALSLPDKATVRLDNGTITTVDIEWDLSNFFVGTELEQFITGNQMFIVNGYLLLPDNIKNNYNIPLVCQIRVMVGENDKGVNKQEREGLAESENESMVMTGDKTQDIFIFMGILSMLFVIFILKNDCGKNI